jgi:Fur family ferric uptake transcriptional regulator
MAQYVTEQKKRLKQLLLENSDRAYTVEELVSKLDKSSDKPSLGKSTVYRLVNKMVDEGAVKRFVRGSRKFAYQIVEGERCSCHLHLKCIGCGKLMHLDEGVSDELLNRVKRVSDFCVSEESTVLFGRCGDCRETDTEKTKQ